MRIICIDIRYSGSDSNIKFIKDRCRNLRILYIFINTIYNIFIKINQYYYIRL